MSYDLEIGVHAKPTRDQIEAWAGQQDLTISSDGDGLVVSTRSTRGDGYLFSIDGPFAAEADDFAEELAGACLAPRWMMTVAVPYSVPKRAITLGRALARHLAETNDGAAFDPQEDSLIWPRGRKKRVAPRRDEEVTSRVTLDWFLPPTRWEEAPATLLRLLRRHTPEALPTRYGRWEPLQHRFDAQDSDAFVRFVLDGEDGDGFWFASRPSFGGSWSAPHADRFVKPEEERLRVANLKVDFDGRVLEQDARWREAVVDLFSAAAVELGALFAAGQVEPGWTVTTNNRLYSTTETMMQGGEHVLRGRLWQGLPPVPVWLGWFGAPYRHLVVPHLTEEALLDGGAPSRRRGLRRLMTRQEDRRVEPQVEQRPDGVFVRLGTEPRPVGELGGWPLPPELTYRYRPPFVEGPDGSVGTDPAQPGDEAQVIPPFN
jgi:hypothetical protein